MPIEALIAAAKEVGKTALEQMSKNIDKLRPDNLNMPIDGLSKNGDMGKHPLAQQCEGIKRVDSDMNKRVDCRVTSDRMQKKEYPNDKKNISKQDIEIIKAESATDIAKEYRSFMNKSIPEQAKELQSIVRDIYNNNSSQGQVEKKLSELHPDMRNKAIKYRQDEIKNIPPQKGPKGYWEGERGNSVYHLNDDYIWKDPKNRWRAPQDRIISSVKELRQKYNIEEPIEIPYKNGEPDFNKYSPLNTKVEFKKDYNYKKLNDLHDNVTENLKIEDNKLDKNAVNPKRNFVENMDTEGNRKEGCRNTYHERRDCKTIDVVPDFIHNICTHNGGREVARILQS